jgi:acetone carboxylase gamma subunit
MPWDIRKTEKTSEEVKALAEGEARPPVDPGVEDAEAMGEVFQNDWLGTERVPFRV